MWRALKAIILWASRVRPLICMKKYLTFPLNNDKYNRLSLFSLMNPFLPWVTETGNLTEIPWHFTRSCLLSIFLEIMFHMN